MLLTSSLENELLHFIQTKQLDTLDISLQEVYSLYSKMIIDILYYVYHSFNNIDYSIACCELSHSIFIITLKHTRNTKLAMFLCDRAKILFIEYINIIYKMDPNKTINLVDIKIYIYSKTIGPLQLSKYNADVDVDVEMDTDMDMNSIQEQTNISKINDLCIIYKQFIYNIYTYLINHIDTYQLISDDNNELDEHNEHDTIDEQYNDNQENVYGINEINKSKLSTVTIDSDNKYKNNSICTILEMIRIALDAKIFKSYLVCNRLYIKELLDIDFESYSTIYIPINKLSIQLQIIIDGKQEHSSKSKKIYTLIQSFTKNEYEHYNYNFIDTEYIRQLHLYNNRMASLEKS